MRNRALGSVLLLLAMTVESEASGFNRSKKILDLTKIEVTERRLAYCKQAALVLY